MLPKFLSFLNRSPKILLTVTNVMTSETVCTYYYDRREATAEGVKRGAKALGITDVCAWVTDANTSKGASLRGLDITGDPIAWIRIEKVGN
jgi:hypothetical protein